MSDDADLNGLPGWRIFRTSLPNPKRPVLVVEAAYYPSMRRCPKCGENRSLRAHGQKRTAYLDLPHPGGTPVRIEVQRRRYLCRSCGATCMQALPDMDDRYRMTQRLLQRLLTEAAKRPFTAVAKETGLHERTVRRIVEQRLPNFVGRARPAYGPPVLGVAKIRLKGRYRTVLVDLIKLIVVDLLPSVRVAALDAWLGRLPPRDRARIQEISSDLKPRELSVPDYSGYIRKALAGLERRYGTEDFAVARGRILAKAAIKAPDGFMFCDDCRQDFAKSRSRAKYSLPARRRDMLRTVRRRCWQCERYIDQWDRGRSRT